ncbi:ABC transporter permease [Myxococcota bacterium]|nr:ABC transporter permease [Myxococcota bacterium]
MQTAPRQNIVRLAIELLFDSLAGIRETNGRVIFKEIFLVANRSLFFVTVVLAFTGAILVAQASMQALRLIGDLSIVGAGFLPLLVREFGPVIVALMVAARYGAGVAAEIGSMVVNEEVDALRMSGITPAGYLVAPKLVAGVVGMFVMAVLGTAAAYISGAMTAHYGFGVGWDTFFKLNLTAPLDAWIGVTKALAFGLAVPLFSGASGLAAGRGAPGVGRAATRAVISSSIAVLALDLIVGSFFYLVFEVGG